MRRLRLLTMAMILVAGLWPAPGAAQEISVTGAGAGVFPEDALYLGLPLSSLSLGMGLGVSGPSAAGEFQVTLTGTNAFGEEQNIVVEGQATGSTPSAPGTASFSGTGTVDPGDGTPLLPGVPFVALVVANPDGTGSLTLDLGGTNLPAATIDEGYLTIQ
jgi:hypothetical protein